MAASQSLQEAQNVVDESHGRFQNIQEDIHLVLLSLEGVERETSSMKCMIKCLFSYISVIRGFQNLKKF